MGGLGESGQNGERSEQMNDEFIFGKLDICENRRIRIKSERIAGIHGLGNLQRECCLGGYEDYLRRTNFPRVFVFPPTRHYSLSLVRKGTREGKGMQRDTIK